MNPRQLVLNPSVVSRGHCGRLVEAANGDIYFVRIRSGQERQWGTTVRAERTQASSPSHFSRWSAGEAKGPQAERCARHEGRAAPTAALETMATGDSIVLPRRLIPDRVTETATS